MQPEGKKIKNCMKTIENEQLSPRIRPRKRKTRRRKLERGAICSGWSQLQRRTGRSPKARPLSSAWRSLRSCVDECSPNIVMNSSELDGMALVVYFKICNFHLEVLELDTFKNEKEFQVFQLVMHNHMNTRACLCFSQTILNRKMLPEGHEAYEWRNA